MRILSLTFVCLGLIGCVSTPPGHDRAQWHADRTDCISQAKQESWAASSASERLTKVAFATSVLAAPVALGPLAIIPALALPAGGPSVLPADNHASQAWMDDRFNQCMVSLGYPPEK